MADDAFEVALDGFMEWADVTGHELHGEIDNDQEELELVVDLLRDRMGMARPGELASTNLTDLMLQVYPDEVELDMVETVDDTIPALRDFVAYLAAHGDVTAADARRMDRELQALAPRFRDKLLARYYADELDDEPFTGFGGDDDDDDDDDSGLKDALGLPDELPPLRLPPDDELAAAARRAPMTGQLLALAGWLGSGKPVDENAELTGPDLSAASAAAGLAGVPELRYLWDIALELDFASLDAEETTASSGPLARSWAAQRDVAVLDTWESVFGLVIGNTLPILAARDVRRSRKLELSGQGAALVMTMFLANSTGVPVSEAGEMLRESAVAELDPDDAVRTWQSWVRAHGEPIQLLLGQLTALGAVTVEAAEEAEAARLTPLGLRAIRTLFVADGVDIPLLPPPDQMTAEQLISTADSMSPDEFQDEVTTWLGCREPDNAARDLLEVAAGDDPAFRMLAVTVVTQLGDPVSAVWTEALGRVELRGYAKAALATLAGESLPDLGLDDIAWMLTDSLVVEGWDDPAEEDAEPDDLAQWLREAVPAGQETEAFEMMARIPHPQAADVLTVIGRMHPDKTTAKAARKAAYKASTRRALS